ncbi:TPA: homoserine dehydrogenase [Candidatus Galligastranaerophilus intestinigallinarum]|nr:homoserine dehydrogenase [Candidatus Galligastranaerophilus intestinigallinarum]
MEKNVLKIGIIGLGVVGTGVVKALSKFENIKILKAAVKNKNKKREVNVQYITDDPFEIANDPEIDVVVEVAGGVDPCLEVLKTAIKNKKHIVTANKELLAKFGDEIFSLANENNVTVLYEAAVAGGIPIIGPIKTTLRGNEFNKVMGILNGTTNYILTKMEEDGVSYLECLKDAQKLGYAEADPTNDVEGFDTMFKIAILSNIVFHKKIDYKKIYREGITHISQDDIKCAKELGYKIKLIGLAQKLENDELDIRVHPVLVEENSMLAKISNAINTVQLEGNPVGSVMFTGPGAGEGPTASSVVGDILAIAAEISYTDTILPSTRVKTDILAKQADILNTKNSYFLAINAQNARGTIGAIGTVCAENNINLQSILQKGIKEDNTALIVVITEASYEADIQNAVKKLNEQNIKVTNLIRVI